MSVWLLDRVDHVLRPGEVDIVVIADYLALRLSLEAHFDDVARLIVEKTVRVSLPRNCSEKDPKN